MKSKNHQKPIKTGPLPEHEFSFALSKLASTQICTSVGYKATHNSALEALTDIAIRYLKAIAKLAAASANSRCRTESNLFDIIVALEDLCSVRGFNGGSDTQVRSLYASQVIKDLMEFVRYAPEIPFAQPIDVDSFCRGGNMNFLKVRGVEDKKNWYCNGVGLMHVPRWLPIMPEMGEEEKEEESKREAKWGCSDGGIVGERKKMIIGEGTVVEENREIELLGKREKLRFKLGVGGSRSGGGGVLRNLRVGVCRGGGIGKRVLCDDRSGSSSEEENTRMMTATNKRLR